MEWEMEIRLFVVEWDALPCLAYAVLTDADENEMQFIPLYAFDRWTPVAMHYVST